MFIERLLHESFQKLRIKNTKAPLTFYQIKPQVPSLIQLKYSNVKKKVFIFYEKVQSVINFMLIKFERKLLFNKIET